MGSGMNFISMCSMLESEISGLKSFINSLETDRISSMLKGLKEDETRLKNCINEIQTFHRDMFVLPSTTEKSADPKNVKMKSECHVTEPECSENKSSNSMITLESERLIMEIPKCLMNKEHSPENDLEDESYEVEEEPCEIVYEVCNIKDESDDDKNASYDVKYESDDIKDATDSTKSDSDSTKSDSFSSKNDSYCSKSESDDNKDEFSDENKLAKKLLLDVLANREAEITSLLLDLISKFNSFQSNLQIAETKISQLDQIYPEITNVTVKKLLNNLRGSVLNLDKTVAKVYGKYFEMLEGLKMDKTIQ